LRGFLGEIGDAILVANGENKLAHELARLQGETETFGRAFTSILSGPRLTDRIRTV
jgi:hypothetical protein